MSPLSIWTMGTDHSWRRTDRLIQNHANQSADIVIQPRKQARGKPLKRPSSAHRTDLQSLVDRTLGGTDISIKIVRFPHLRKATPLLRPQSCS